jgi:hypothetical protein
MALYSGPVLRRVYGGTTGELSTMPRKPEYRKTAVRPVRFNPQQLERVEKAAERLTAREGRIVTAADVIRDGATRLADEILAAA